MIVFSKSRKFVIYHIHFDLADHRDFFVERVPVIQLSAVVEELEEFVYYQFQKQIRTTF